MKSPSNYLDREVRELNAGSHCCFIYQDEAEQLAVLVPYLLQGLEQGEKCLCILESATEKALIRALKSAGIDVNRERRRKALVFQSAGETYFPNGYFDGSEMKGLLKDCIRQSKEEGFSGFRATGNLSWALDGGPGCETLFGYEGSLDELFSEQGATGLCLYAKSKFPNEMIHKAVATHELAIIEEGARTNHYSFRIGRGGWFADIVASKNDVQPIYHYIVQREGSSQVLGWGQSLELSAARAEAEFILFQYASTKLGANQQSA